MDYWHFSFMFNTQRKEHMLSNNTTYFRLIYFIEQDNNDCKFQEDFMFKVIKFNNRHNGSNLVLKAITSLKFNPYSEDHSTNI